MALKNFITQCTNCCGSGKICAGDLNLDRDLFSCAAELKWNFNYRSFDRLFRFRALPWSGGSVWKGETVLSRGGGGGAGSGGAAPRGQQSRARRGCAERWETTASAAGSVSAALPRPPGSRQSYTWA